MLKLVPWSVQCKRTGSRAHAGREEIVCSRPGKHQTPPCYLIRQGVRRGRSSTVVQCLILETFLGLGNFKSGSMWCARGQNYGYTGIHSRGLSTAVVSWKERKKGQKAAEDLGDKNRSCSGGGLQVLRVRLKIATAERHNRSDI